MGPGVDKLFLDVAGEPVVAHTWRRFDEHPGIQSVVLVIRPDLEAAFDEMAAELGFRKPYSLVAGGNERQDSVWNGLAALPDGCDVVAIQDGARPCTSSELITRCLAAARRMGASVAGQKATDTIKEADGEGHIAKHLDRSRLWAVQTPQCFRANVIRRALEAVRAQGFLITDDTAACDLIGQAVELVEAQSPNPKVTVPADVPYVRLLLEQGLG
jgi:2-C-methyl-D-erythritol 4-phosphate cytidylyltransferase